MFCPQCGQQQISREVRFCSTCGFPLNVISEALTGGGQLRHRPVEAGAHQLSPRQKGIRQGAMLMMSVVVVMPVVIFLGVALMNLPGELIPLAGAICVMGGLLRIIYASLFESNVPHSFNAQSGAPPSSYLPPTVAPTYLNTPTRGGALPASPPQPAASAYRPPQYRTDELAARPPSVTENTTRLLKDQTTDEPRQD